MTFNQSGQYIPDRPPFVMSGAVGAAYHMFDELVKVVPISPELADVRRRISKARARNGEALEAEQIAQRLLTAQPTSWCDLVARAELVCHSAGAHQIDDLPATFDASRLHERLAVDLILTIVKLGTAPPQPVKKPQRNLLSKTHEGHVYLARSGPYFKIGRTVSVQRRKAQLSIQLPDKLEMLHAISTHDPAAVEKYWHKCFAERRLNGEWFALTPEDIAAFTSWITTERGTKGLHRVRVTAAASQDR